MKTKRVLTLLILVGLVYLASYASVCPLCYMNKPAKAPSKRFFIKLLF